MHNFNTLQLSYSLYYQKTFYTTLDDFDEKVVFYVIDIWWRLSKWSLCIQIKAITFTSNISISANSKIKSVTGVYELKTGPNIVAKISQAWHVKLKQTDV